MSRRAHHTSRDPSDGERTPARRASGAGATGAGATSGRLRNGGAVSPTDSASAMADAVRRVLARRSEWAPEALEKEEGYRHAEWIRATVVDRAELADVDGWTAAEKTLTRRLVDLLRCELLERERRLPAEELLELLRPLEAIRTRLAPPQHQILATRLMGANAADLVVELAHDLRSPLTSIMFLSETLRRGQTGQVNDVQRQQLGIIYSAALSLTTIASDLIDLGREDRYLTAEAASKTPLSLREMFDAVKAMVAPMAEEKRLDILTLGPDQDLRLGNAVSLSRILLNLTANAIKFTESGYVEIVAQEHGPRRVEFSVRDTGRGMDPTTLDRLFEPFHRGQTRTGFHFSETGLGLTICRRLVGLMGGTLEVETRAGWGTRFFFEIEMPRGTRV
jgi:signal transduction histidine kinase